MIKLSLRGKKLGSLAFMVITLILGFSVNSSSAATLNYEPNQEQQNIRSPLFNRLALTLINYDHYTNVASNLSLNTLDFTEYQREDLATQMDNYFILAQSDSVNPLSYNEGVLLLLAGNSNIPNISQLEMKSETYMASQVEIIDPQNNANSSDIALLARAENVNDIYDSVYEFNAELKHKEFDMNSSLGEMRGQTASNSLSQNNLLHSNQSTYYGLQQQLMTNIAEYTREKRRRRFQLFGNRQQDPTIAQINNPLPAVPTQTAGGGSSWFVFFSIGQRDSSTGNLLASGESDYVQQQLMLQRNSRANVENRARSFYGSRMNRTVSNFGY